jgi:hypothetical protein
MTDSLVNVLVPYSRFLECQDRRRRIAAELTRRDQPPTTDALTSGSVSNADTGSPRPLPSSGTSS